MASSTFPTPYAEQQAGTQVASKTSSVPWYLWFGALAVTSVLDRGSMGRRLASIHRSRHLLDAGTYSDPGLWSNGRDHLRLSGPGEHRRTLRQVAGRVSQRARLSRPTGCLHRRMGRHRDDHLSPIRQLVACGLRTRRQDRQPAPHPPHPGSPRCRNRHFVPHPRRNEPRRCRQYVVRQNEPISRCSASSFT